MQNPIPLFAPVTRAIRPVCVAKAAAVGDIMGKEEENIGSLRIAEPLISDRSK